MRKLLIALGTLLVLVVIADRIAPRVAGGVVAKQLQSEGSLPNKPDVTFHGFPFLTQALGGKYGDVEVRASGITVGSLHGVGVKAHFRGLHAPLGDVVSGDISKVPVDRITGTSSLSYDDLAAAAADQFGQDFTLESISRDGDRLKVRVSSTLAGEKIFASALAKVTVSDNSLVAQSGDLTFENLPPGVPEPRLPQGLSFQLSMDGLPFHLQVTDVELGENSLSVSMQARDVVLGSTTLRGSR